jgi:hypothetical protein
MKKSKQKKSYTLRQGMIFEKVYYGNTLRLLVVEHHGVLQFKVADEIFPTLTAAARHVCGDATRQISGPLFWGVKG